MKVLFADDDEVTIFLYQRLSRKMGWDNVAYAKNGREALECVNQATEPIDALFLDLNMPEMNGLEFLEKHEALPEERKVKHVYIMMGSEMPDTVKSKVANYNIASLISKPLNLEKVNALSSIV